LIFAWPAACSSKAGRISPRAVRRSGTTYTHDALDRVTVETYPDSSTTQHTFNDLVTTDTNAKRQARRRCPIP